MAERLIDAEALRKEMQEYVLPITTNNLMGAADAYYRILHLLEDAPTIEAKPVVHCKDCKYNVANRQQDPLDITDYTDIVCDYFMTDGMEADDFCSFGKKVEK